MQDNLLWQYSLAVYRRPDVAPLLIALQDHDNADVNILLSCGWLGTQGQCLSLEHLQQLITIATPWQEQCVQPLRAIRRFLTDSGDDAFREQVKRLEIDAELRQQNLIYQQLQSLTLCTADPAKAMIDNLDLYGSQLAATDREKLLTDLTRLAALIK